MSERGYGYPTGLLVVRPLSCKRSLDATVWDEPYQRHQHIQSPCDPLVHKCGWDCDGIKQEEGAERDLQYPFGRGTYKHRMICTPVSSGSLQMR